MSDVTLNEGFATDSEGESEGSAPKGETKSEKFRRLAKPRVEKTLHALDQIGNLSNRGSYEYTEAEIEKMFSAIRAKLDDVQGKFSKSEKKSDSFSFD